MSDLNNYVQPVNRHSDIDDVSLDQENKQGLLSEAFSEELMTVIDSYDVEDPSSELFDPDHFYHIPKKIEPDNVWYTTGVELEDLSVPTWE